MLKKIKSITIVVSVLTAVFTLFSYGPTALAINPDAGNVNSTAINACTGLSGAALSTCNVCHPEVNGGLALSESQQKSCENCNDPNLQAKDPATQHAALQTCLKENPIVSRLNEVINILAGLVGVVVVGVIIVGGIQYSIAGGKPEAVSAARKRIGKALIAFFMFLFIWGFLQWLIPGGVL